MENPGHEEESNTPTTAPTTPTIKKNSTPDDPTTPTTYTPMDTPLLFKEFRGGIIKN